MYEGESTENLKSAIKTEPQLDCLMRVNSDTDGLKNGRQVTMEAT